MNSRTRALSFTALSVAGAVVMLYMGTLFTPMALTFAALAAIFVAVSVIEGGLKYGLFCFVATAILGLVLVALQPVVILYLTFLGAYPIIKSIAERQKLQIVGWIIKYAAFFLALTLYLTILEALLLGAVPFMDEAWPLIYLGGAVVFFIYDVGMSKLIGFYLARIYKYRNS